MNDSETSGESPPLEHFRLLESTAPPSIIVNREYEILHLSDKAAQYESGAEELKASNEELQAMNEELRSATEELETSREELQSINEELSTVNQELKSNIDELGHANSDLNNLMASTDIATVFLDRTLCIARYTPPAITLFRLIPGDVGRPLGDLQHRLHYPELAADAERVLATLTPVEREVSSAAGKWYLARTLAYRTAQDMIVGVVLTFVEITARKQAEESLKERTAELAAEVAKFAAVIDSFSDFVYTFDLDGRFTSANRPLAELLGRQPSEMIEKNFHDLEYPPALATRLQQQIQEVIESGGPVRGATEFTTAAGSRQYEYIFTPAFGLDGSVRSVSGVTRDMSDRLAEQEALRSSEERLRLVVENARDYAIFSTDLNRRVTGWNSGAERLLGHAEAEILGQLADVIFTPEDREAGACEQEARTALAEGRATDERWHLRKDGTRFWGSGVMMAMRDTAGVAVGLVKIFRDQTAERAAQQALEESRGLLWEALQENERARADAEAAGQAKDHFLAVLSHELRTPLTPVLVALHLLMRQKKLPAKVMDSLTMIKRNIEMEAHFIDDMLDVTRIARGRIDVLREPMDVHDAVRHAVEISRGDIDGKKQNLRVELAAAEHQLSGDFNRLQQAFWNLLKNASKFTPVGGEITVRSRNESARLVIEVIDNGIGLEAEAVTKIFSAFEQADDTIAARFGGLGLGLAIAKATIDAHGGELRASSSGAGQGSTFTVELPL